jgi:hypothetical protein
MTASAATSLFIGYSNLELYYRATGIIFTFCLPGE